MHLILLCLPLAASAGGTDGSPIDNSGQLSFPEISFGFKAGISLAQHTGVEERDSEYTVSSHWRTGFAVGAFLYLPVTPRFGLQQEVFYSQKGSRQDIGVDILDIPTILDVTYDMDYIEIPVLTRFTWAIWGGNSVYSLAGTVLSFKVRDRYTLTGEIDDGDQVVPLEADADMSEVEMFDYSFLFGFGLEHSFFSRIFLLEYRFTIGWNQLQMPTYCYVPFGDERILIDNEPVPLKNQNHQIVVGIRF
jgi:hypothetical protein